MVGVGLCRVAILFGGARPVNTTTKIRYILLMWVMCSLAGHANASTVSGYTDVTGTPLLIFALTSFTTTGADMSVGTGLLVTVHFVNATTGVAGGFPPFGCYATWPGRGR